MNKMDMPLIYSTLVTLNFHCTLLLLYSLGHTAVCFQVCRVINTERDGMYKYRARQYNKHSKHDIVPRSLSLITVRPRDA